MHRPTPVNRERTFGDDEIIVSKTDTKGRITYVNDVFCRVGLYNEDELFGAPHSIIRHPDMPRAVFHLLWQQIEAGQEIFAYVKNLAKSGEFYWVFAHVTPSYGKDGQIIGYHSNRRTPDRRALPVIEPLYRDLLGIEQRHPDRKLGMMEAVAHLQATLEKTGMVYDEFVQSLGA